MPGKGSLVSELIALAGGASVTADQGRGYPRMSLEAAVGRTPEVIILARHGSRVGPAAREQWQRLFNPGSWFWIPSSWSGDGEAAGAEQT